MINLLFISNSHKMDLIKKSLQPMLKIKIDIVTDFDHGLRDVFEKRPATIIIQDQISGVTGESVARHIQMLLGSGSPSFILVHDGNPRVKPINGLFEHLIDLTLPDEALTAEVQAALKVVFGADWDKIIIVPKPDIASFTLPEEHREHADRLLEDFLSDLGSSESQSREQTENKPHLVQISEPLENDYLVEDTHDELSRIQTEVQAAEPININTAYEPEPKLQNIPAKPEKKAKTPKPKKAPAPAPAKVDEMHDELPESANVVNEVLAVAAVEPCVPETNFEIDDKSPVAEEKVFEIRNQESVGDPTSINSNPSPHKAPVQDEEIPEDILTAFEDNYRAQRRTWKNLFTGIAVTVLALGCLWYFKQSPQQLSTKPAVGPTAVSAPVVKKAASVTAASNQMINKPLSSSRKPLVETHSNLPSFIPAEKRDLAFSKSKPGWERYVGQNFEYRLFRSGQQIKAVQILAGGTKPVSDVFFKQALKEITGSSNYQINSKEEKQGYLIQRGSIGNKGDLLIYRTQKGQIRAFVVSPISH